MNSLFGKRLLWLCIFVFMGTGGCSTMTPSMTAVTPSPTAVPPAPTAIPSPTIATIELTPTSTALVTQNSLVSKQDKATLVSESYLDNSKLKPDERFIKTWEIKNIGIMTWTAAYTLILSAAPQGDTLGGSPQINIPQEASPGKTISLSLPLVAPAKPGIYSVYWTLKNERGETVPVDGGNIWVRIQVCDPNQSCNPPTVSGGVVASGISATLTSFTPGGQSALADFCMTLPNRNYGPGGGSVSLKVDQKTILASNGGSLASGCFDFEFPIGAAELSQAKSVSISIDNVRIIGGGSNSDCEAARSALKQKYPGLDFQCNISSGMYYTNLHLPASMTTAQAQQLIIDAIEQAVYGPWVLTIR